MDEIFLEKLVFWHWWVLATALLILEIFAPATFFVWIGLSAAAVGGILLFAPELSWEYQLLVFSILSMLTVVAGKLFFNTHAKETDHPKLNRRGEQYIGNNYVLQSELKNGAGHIKVADTIWRVEGPDLPAGATVTVTGVSGASLLVSKQESTDG